MRPFNLIANTGYYGPDYTSLLYCALALFCLIWGVHGLYRTHRDKHHLAMRENFMRVNERLGALKLWAHANYDTRSSSNSVQMLFDLVEGREDHRVCANCGVYTDNFCIIEKGPPEENWIEDIWVKMGMLGKPICGECYYQ